MKERLQSLARVAIYNMHGVVVVVCARLFTSSILVTYDSFVTLVTYLVTCDHDSLCACDMSYRFENDHSVLRFTGSQSQLGESRHESRNENLMLMKSSDNATQQT